MADNAVFLFYFILFFSEIKKLKMKLNKGWIHVAADIQRSGGEIYQGFVNEAYLKTVFISFLLYVREDLITASF